MKEGQDRPHIGMDVDWDEGGVATTRKGETLQVGMDAWLSGEETVYGERCVFR